MIKNLKKLKQFINFNNLDGYLVPKNDNFFTEYSNTNNLYEVSNFNGSAGFALILKNYNYLFVDGRYTLQAKEQSGRNFKIFEIPHFWPKDLKKINDYKIGFNPKLFTENTLKKYFEKKVNLIPIEYKFKSKKEKKINKIFQLQKSVTGETSISKINKIRKLLVQKKLTYLYVSASENINWLLNIRGKDLPHSPLVNCKLILSNNGELYCFINLKKISKLNKKIFNKINFFKEEDLFKVITRLKKGCFCIDKNSCSIYEKKIISSKFNISSDIDPIYNFKSVKNKVEIKNTFKAHIEDGVALTKFLHWFKTSKKELDEKIIEKKLEEFRKKSNNYLYPSFDKIAGSGKNGALIHYRSTHLSNRKLKKNDILLIDSGGQYKWGTTDVTRTISLGKIPTNIKNIFTRVLKGHIAVITSNLKKKFNGHLLDKVARRPLNNVGLDYAHGTGHGVGFFLNVHEGPQGISKNNKINLKKGMILSNEPGYYLKNKFGIRIENLIYVDKLSNNLFFKNLTFAPIDLDMINFKMLNKIERKYLFDYHLEVYARISKYLNKPEKKWMLNLIN